MSNLSLARIMYGTSEDMRSTVSSIPSAPLASPAYPGLSLTAQATGSSVEQLFHRAWHAFSDKK